ncbi:MAG: hypothetical protein GX783_03390 [Clostridiales bacterium]|nr:hypothetical protein [Clostridiales bacterium]
MYKLSSRLLTIGLILVLLATGCSNGATNNNKDNNDNKPTIEPPQEINTETVTLVIPNSIENEDYKEHAEKLLSDRGFSIKFVGYDKGSGYIDNQKYLDFCLGIGKDHENVVMFFDGPVPENNAAELFQDISGMYGILAPKHHELFSNEDDRYGIVTSVNDGTQSQRLAVLIRNEYYEEYEGSIRSATDYEAFLEWANENIKDDRTPGLIPAFMYEKAYHNTHVAFDIFIPELGYTSLAPALPINIGGLYIKNEQSIVEEVDVFPLDSLPEFKEAALRLGEWVQNEWIDVVNYDEAIPDIDKYASVVINPADYSSRQLEHWFPGKQMRIEATEFSMFILYPDEMPDPWLDTIQPLYYAYVLKGSTNPNEFFKFIEWLYSDENNYREFTGQNLDGANSMPDQAYRQWSALTYFYNSKWNPISSVAPSNYEVEMKELTHFNLPILELLTDNRASIQKIQFELWDQNGYNSIENREKSYGQLIRNLYIAKNEDPEAIIEKFVEQQDYTEELELKIKSLINEANK